MTTELSLKERIRRGDVIVALRAPITTSRSQLEDGLAQGAFDLLYLDGQHTAFSDDQIVSFCAQAETLGLPVQFRLPHTRQTYLIGRFLDLGLSAILVPEVMDEATVDDAIDFAYYPQIGRRSWGGAARFGVSTWNGPLDRLAYAAWWNDHVVLSIQFESIEAINNARRLAKPGVDYVAFGPNDLQFSIEGHAEFPLRTPDECMHNVADQLRGTGIRLGMAVTTTPGERDKYLEMGITLFQEALRM